ncbi:hypothetical protein [Streptomyces caniscabiei]|uniref:Uncharacterized protein n=1 Tax=Streptomyces caniscabiei TaxID=2746961 RepID=A0ABU4MYG0_9ACTN|nr:hypothetical protein [Streptomyces caniscabiei]MBE4790250.1 hypothetical protein [Streptomyces caniscabiei]MBE4799521.1 hypothetical protein [Streptomyces caniscabiei]MDX3015235.1 hypothetical protein [Streptomyces caniscabiei]MDX3042550.1 hypothetical protein [Streptomyces caniscabiei]
MQQPDLEQMPGAEWSAGAVAQCYPDLYDDIVDLFTSLDPRQITDQVMRDREVDFRSAVASLDDWFGEIADPYADEDDA